MGTTIPETSESRILPLKTNTQYCEHISRLLLWNLMKINVTGIPILHSTGRTSHPDTSQALSVYFKRMLVCDVPQPCQDATWALPQSPRERDPIAVGFHGLQK